MGMFVKAEHIPVSDDKGNTIYIRSKMDYGTANKVNGAALKVKPGMTKQEIENLDIDIGAYQTALLQYNIVRWEGPDFTDPAGRVIPCNPLKIAEFDPDQPLLAAVLEKIAERNKKRESPDPKEPVMPIGSMDDGAID